MSLNRASHPLRALAARIEQLAKDDPAYSQAHDIVTNCVDHLCAVARTHEANEEIKEIKNGRA